MSVNLHDNSLLASQGQYSPNMLSKESINIRLHFHRGISGNNEVKLHRQDATRYLLPDAVRALHIHRKRCLQQHKRCQKRTDERTTGRNNGSISTTGLAG